MSQVGSPAAATGAPIPPIGPHQIHDYSPGISENGLFWTIAIPPDSVAFDPDLNRGSYRQSDLDLVDAFNLANALAEGPTVPARVSFDVGWSATSPAKAVRNDTHGFVGEFRDSRAAIAWSGSTDASRFVSAPADTSKPIYGFIGRERNGVFFS